MCHSRARPARSRRCRESSAPGAAGTNGSGTGAAPAGGEQRAGLPCPARDTPGHLNPPAPWNCGCSGLSRVKAWFCRDGWGSCRNEAGLRFGSGALLHLSNLKFPPCPRLHILLNPFSPLDFRGAQQCPPWDRSGCGRVRKPPGKFNPVSPTASAEIWGSSSSSCLPSPSLPGLLWDPGAAGRDFSLSAALPCFVSARISVKSAPWEGVAELARR